MDQAAGPAPAKSGFWNNMLIGFLAWLIKAATGYGASLIMTLVFLWAISRVENPGGSDAFFSWYALLMDVYLFLQGVLILRGTSGRNIGKDFLGILDIMLSLLPIVVIGFVVQNHFTDTMKNPLSATDWQIISKTATTVLFDVIILGWLGARVSRLMGEVHVTNRT